MADVGVDGSGAEVPEIFERMTPPRVTVGARGEGSWERPWSRGRAEEVVRLMEEMVGVGSWRVDFPTGRAVWSDEVYRIHGMPPGRDVSLDDAINAYHEDDRERVRELVGRAIRDGKAFDFEARLSRGDGELIWVHAIGRVSKGGADGERSVYGCIQDITELKLRAEEERERAERERLLHREMEHRMRNSLASLSVLVDLSRDRALSVDELADAVQRRIRAIADVHSLLSAGRFESVLLSEIVRSAASGAGPGRVESSGPEVRVPARQVPAVGIIVAELVQNSLKHGAAGVAGGVLRMSWEIESGDEADEGVDGTGVVLRAVESGSRMGDGGVVPGVGLELIRGLTGGELRGSADLDFGPSGADHTLRMVFDLEA